MLITKKFTIYFVLSRATSDFHGYMPEPDFQSVSLDTHNYQCFNAYWNDMADTDVLTVFLSFWDLRAQKLLVNAGEIDT